MKEPARMPSGVAFRNQHPLAAGRIENAVVRETRLRSLHQRRCRQRNPRHKSAKAEDRWSVISGKQRHRTSWLRGRPLLRRAGGRNRRGINNLVPLTRHPKGIGPAERQAFG
jgi:hypothetical protein